MRTVAVLMALFVAMLAGCRHAPPTVHYPPAVSPPPPALTVAAVPLTPFEPPLASLPLVDPTTADVSGYHRPLPVGVSLDTVVTQAAAHAPLAIAIEQEAGVPVVGDSAQPSPDFVLLRELRQLAAAELRSRAAGEAAMAYFQLADVEGRLLIVRESVASLDTLRAVVKDVLAKGGKPLIDPDELDRQRATLVALVGQAEAGAALLDVDLKRRIGANGRAVERLVPTGEFGISSDVPDAAAVVATALERRTDLLALRTAYLKLTPETLPDVREFLRSVPGAAGALGGVGPRLPVVRRMVQKRWDEAAAVIRQAAEAEVQVRRTQLVSLIEEAERQAAAEVRAAVASLTEQTRQVGLARWRVEKVRAKLAEVKKQDDGPAAVVPAEAEVSRARADLVQAVMAWHQSRAKLATATGAWNRDR